MNHFLFMILHKKANLPTLHRFIKCRFLVSFHPNAFERLCIPSSSRSNHNCKVLIMLHLGLHVERDGPNTPCSHAEKMKNVVQG
jgi:hypothetical protein